MRGSPPLHLVIFIIAFGLLAVPLGHLTFARLQPPPIEAAVLKSEVNLQTFIRVRYAHPPQTLSLKLYGRELLPEAKGRQAGSVIEVRTEVAIPTEGIALFLKASWAHGTPETAITVEVEPHEKDQQSQTRWSLDNEIGEELLFQWPS